MMAPPFPLDFWQVHAPALKTRNACEMTCLSSGYWAARSTTELVPHGTLSFPLHGIYGLSWRLLFRVLHHLIHVPIPNPETGRSAALIIRSQRFPTASRTLPIPILLTSETKRIPAAVLWNQLAPFLSFIIHTPILTEIVLGF